MDAIISWLEGQSPYVLVAWGLGGLSLIVIIIYNTLKGNKDNKQRTISLKRASRANQIISEPLDAETQALMELILGEVETVALQAGVARDNGNGKKGEPTTIEVMTSDDYKRNWYCEALPIEKVKAIHSEYGNLGRKWLWYNKYVYALNKDIYGHYRPEEIPQTLENPPSRLYRALMQQAVGIFYRIPTEGNFMQRYGKILLLIGAVMFFLWTIIMK